MSEPEDTMEQIRESLEHKDFTGLKKIILEDKFSNEDKFWDLLSELGGCITEDNLQNCYGFFETCERCMLYLINRGNPKELILALLEQTDQFNETVKFTVFLKLIQKTLMKLESKRQFSFELAVETLSAHIEGIVLPADLNVDLEGKEARIQETDPQVKECLIALSEYLKFLSGFVEEVAIDNMSRNQVESCDRQVVVLVKYLLLLLGHPLSSLHLSFDSKAARPVKSNSWVCAEKVVTLLSKLQPNFHTLIMDTLQNNEKIAKMQVMDAPDSDDQLFMRDDKPVPLLSLSCLLYLIHCQRLGIYDYPWIYPNQYMLEFSLKYVLTMLNRKDGFIARKGVDLLQCMVDRMDQGSVSADALDDKSYFACLDALVVVMTHYPMRIIRQASVQLLPCFINMFDIQGRYQIFLKLLSTCQHAGVTGHCIHLLKNQINELLSNREQKKQFLKENLLRLLEHILRLPEGPASDLLELSDKIIAALNFIRYLVLKDPEQRNQTGIWDYFVDVETYLNDLRTGLDMSKGHYQMEVSLMNEGKKVGVGEEEPEMTLRVAGLPMPQMDRGQKMEVLRQALNSFDMIDSLLCRVNELIEQGKAGVSQSK